MFVSLKDVINLPEFADVEILAGKNGLYRNVTSISINDLRKEFVTLDCISTGDLYITSLHQYAKDCNDAELWAFVKTFIDKNCSGLIIVSKDNLQLLTKEIINQCNSERFPLLYFAEEKRYVDIMKAVNKYIALETYNASRAYRIQNILSENLSEEDVLSILNSFESGIESNIKVIAFGSDATSPMRKREFEVKALSSACNAFIDCSYIKYYLVSAKDIYYLEKQVMSVKHTIRDHYNVQALGISKTYEKRQFKNALIEARNAYKISKYTDTAEFMFPEVSTFGIVAATADSSEAKDYYNSVVKVIDHHTSIEHRNEVLDTIKAFVKNKGDFKKTAFDVAQHENTVRYRINKLKTWLDMEDDNISFYETISLITKYSQFYD